MNIIQSAGGIVYHLDSNNQPRYLLIKRHALSKKVEWVAPKGKIQEGESVETAALREIAEETGLQPDQLHIKQKIGTTQLRNPTHQKGMFNKDVTYFLVEYKGEPSKVRIQEGEGYIGQHKRATIQEVLALVYYSDMRELIREAHITFQSLAKKGPAQQTAPTKREEAPAR